VTLLLYRELVSRVKLCLVNVFPDIVQPVRHRKILGFQIFSCDCPKIRNLPKIFLRSFENVAPGS